MQNAGHASFHQKSAGSSPTVFPQKCLLVFGGGGEGERGDNMKYQKSRNGPINGIGIFTQVNSTS